MQGRIIAAARRLIADRGYEATSLREVVAQAGTSIGNCYFYFPTKEALLRATIRVAAAEVAARIDAAMAGVRSGPAQAAIGVYAAVSMALASPERGRLVFVEGAHIRAREEMARMFGDRVRAFFASRPRLARSHSLDFLAHAWVGTMLHVIEGGLRGSLSGTPKELGRLCAQWNMRALDLPASDIEAALRALDRHIAREPAA